MTCEVQVTHLLSVQHSSPVELSRALLLPHIVAKSEQTHSSAAQAHLWEGWYVESSPAGSGTLQGARREQTEVFQRARAGSRTSSCTPGPHGSSHEPQGSTESSALPLLGSLLFSIPRLTLTAIPRPPSPSIK